MNIVVIGMGYVGIPCAALLADVPGFRVTGVQRRSKRSGWKIEWLNAGKSPFQGHEPGLAELIHRVVVEKGTFRVTDDYAVCREADVILIDVQTPTDENHVPDYGALRQACEEVGRYLQPETLVIIESTVAPGTTQNVVQPILERESGLKAGSNFEIRNPRFYLAFSYERVMPGKLLEYITDMPRVVGGIDEESTRRAVELYRHIVRKEITPTDCLTAEMAKVVENAYRDVNIAFANEVALACERMGVDVYEVRRLINARPDRHMHLPGAGVGGHCLPKDPWLLKYGVETYGSRITDHASRGANQQIGKSASELRLIPVAREINDGMPLHMVELIGEALAEAGVELAGAKVAVLGVAYLEDSDDTRNTPAAPLAALLRARGAEVVAHDPYVRERDWVESGGDGVPLTRNLAEALEGADCAAIVTRHRPYLDFPLETGSFAYADARRVGWAECLGWRGVQAERDRLQGDRQGTERYHMTPCTLRIEVVDIQGHCPVYKVGDGFHIVDGYKLVADSPLCMHALQSLAPYYVALSRGVKPADLGLAGPDGVAYVQCLDPQHYTGGGTVTFRMCAEEPGSRGELHRLLSAKS